MKHLAFSKKDDETYTEFLQKFGMAVDGLQHNEANLRNIVINLTDSYLSLESSQVEAVVYFESNKPQEGFGVKTANVSSNPNLKTTDALLESTAKVNEWLKANSDATVLDVKTDIFMDKQGNYVASTDVYYD